jgi:hypothetical protein
MKPLVRLPGWRSALNGVIADHRRRIFAYGSADCALLAADAVLAETGVDLAAGFRGRYATLREGLALMQAAGFARHTDMIAANLPERHPALLRAGDLGFLEVGDVPVPAVVLGALVAAHTENGLAFLDRTRLVRGFAVG